MDQSHAPSVAGMIRFPAEVDIWCPIAEKTHPLGAEALDAVVVAWLIKHGVCEPGSTGTRINLGAPFASGMPFVSEAALIAMTTYAHWGFLWDDYLDTVYDDLATVGVQVAEVMRIMNEPLSAPVPENRWLRSFRDARRLLEEALPPLGFLQLQQAHSNWVSGELWKACLRDRPTPSVDEYLRMRWAKTGFETFIAYTAAAAGYAMLPEHLADPAVRAFCQATLLPCAIMNDLGSFAKETITGDVGLNLVTIIATEHGMRRGDAMIRILELYERVVGVMLALRERLLADPRPGVARLATDLPQWLPATLNFTGDSPRYTELPALGQTQPATTQLPRLNLINKPLLWPADNLTPPPYETISWWWHQLDP
jgi:hypothetical protein